MAPQWLYLLIPTFSEITVLKIHWVVTKRLCHILGCNFQFLTRGFLTASCLVLGMHRVAMSNYLAGRSLLTTFWETRSDIGYFLTYFCFWTHFQSSAHHLLICWWREWCWLWSRYCRWPTEAFLPPRGGGDSIQCSDALSPDTAETELSRRTAAPLSVPVQQTPLPPSLLQCRHLLVAIFGAR